MKLIILGSIFLTLLSSVFAQSDAGVFQYAYRQAFGSVDTVEVVYDGKRIESFELADAGTTKTKDGYEVESSYRRGTWSLSLADSSVKQCRTVDHGGILHLRAEYRGALAWTITGETKQAYGRTLVRAETKAIEDANSYVFFGTAVAWFDPNELVPVGPDQYWGLPGLIVELGFTEAGWRYELVAKPAAPTIAPRVTCESDRAIVVSRDIILNPWNYGKKYFKG